MTTKIFAIFDTESNTFLSFPPKCAWATVGAAKNAFALHHREYDNTLKYHKSVKFDNQSRCKIVELSEMYFQLKDLEKEYGYW